MMIAVIVWICSDAAELTQSIKDSEIQPGALVFFHHSRRQKSEDLNERATQMSMELACIMDPPFDSDRRRVNIQKVFDPAVKVGVKPKHLVLAKSMFHDESALAPSPNQKLKLEIYKMPDDQKPYQTMWKQLILVDQLEHCDEIFLMYSKKTLDAMKTILKHTVKCRVFFSPDMQGLWMDCPESQEYLIQFLNKILDPSYLDTNTLDDFRDMVANYVFSYYVNSAPEFERYIDILPRSLPRSMKILRIFYRNLQRNKPTVCPKLEVMRDDFVDYKMVPDMLAVILGKFKRVEANLAYHHLSDLYKLMGSDAESCKAMWDLGREKWSETGWMAKIADLVSRKMGFRTPEITDIPDEDLLRMVERVRDEMADGWRNKMRMMTFDRYWERLYQLKCSGFSGRIAIVNRAHILDDAWVQSLLGIFGRDSTVVELIEKL